MQSLADLVAKTQAIVTQSPYQAACEHLNAIVASNLALQQHTDALHSIIESLMTIAVESGERMHQAIAAYREMREQFKRLSIEHESLVGAIEDADDTHPLVSSLLDYVYDSLAGEYRYDESMRDIVHEEQGKVLAEALGLPHAQACYFIDVITDTDRLIPEDEARELASIIDRLYLSRFAKRGNR